MPRPWTFAAGMLVLAAAWLSRGHAFSAHLTVHMSVVAIAAPLLALGIAGGRWDVAALAPRLFAPVPASVVELAVVWAWHTPVLHHAAGADVGVYAAEQLSFLVSGLYLWMSALAANRSGEGLIALLLTAMHMTLLGALLGLAPRPLYHGALDDQHLGGAIMILIGGVSYLAGGLWLGARLLRHGSYLRLSR